MELNKYEISIWLSDYTHIFTGAKHCNCAIFTGHGVHVGKNQHLLWHIIQSYELQLASIACLFKGGMRIMPN